MAAKRAPLTLFQDRVTEPMTPVSVCANELFGRDENLAGLWFTVFDVSGVERRRVPSSFWHWRAQLNFLVVDPSHLQYEVIASRDIPEEPTGPAGCGDILRLAPNLPAPVEVSMHATPIFCDWFGRGRTDLLLCGDYSCGLGETYGGIWYFENLGSEAEPVYAPPIPLVDREGEKVTHYYVAADLFLFRDSPLPGLIVAGYGAPSLFCYLNEGRRDRFGRPVVQQIAEVPLDRRRPSPAHLRAVECFGDGVQHVFVSWGQTPEGENWGIGARFPSVFVEYLHNEAPPGEVPRLSAPVLLRTPGGGPLTCLSGSGAAEICDWNGDGKLDVILTHSGPVPPTVRFAENVGPDGEWTFEDRGTPQGLEDPLRIGRKPLWVERGQFRGIAFGMCDGRVKLYRAIGPHERGLPRFEAAGHLKGYGCPLSAGVYSVPYVCDWDGDGGRDLVVGCDHGPVWLMRELVGSTPLFPKYAPPEVIRKRDGSMLELRLKDYPNEQFAGGMHGEMWLGMSRPQVVDWEGRGRLDILLSGLTHRLLLFRNVGSREKPQFEGPEHVAVDGMDDPFAYRQHIVAVDWNRDGLLDLIALDIHRNYTFFERYRAGNRSLRLRFGYHLRYEDGELVTHESVHPWGNYLSPCDWDGDGNWDLVIGIGQDNGVVLLENVGTVEEPIFRRPRQILVSGEPIRHSPHGQRPFAVDWDGLGRLDLLCGVESGWLHLYRRAILTLADEPFDPSR